MSEAEAIECVRKLKRLFSGTNVEAAEFWMKEFLSHAVATVTDALDRYAREHNDFIDRPEFLGMLRRERDARSRWLASARESEAARDEAARDAAAYGETWARMRERVESRPPELIEAVRLEAIARFAKDRPFFLRHVEGRTHATSRLLLVAMSGLLRELDATGAAGGAALLMPGGEGERRVGA